MTFYERLRKICEDNDTTPTTVAKRLGISTGSVSAWKNGSTPSGENLAKLAYYFDTTVEYLLNGTEPKVFETDEVEEEIFEAISLLKDPKMRRLVQRLRNASYEDFRKIDKLLDVLGLGAENG